MSVLDGEVVRCAARLRAASGDDIVNVFHWRYNGSPVDLATIAVAVSYQLNAMYNNIQPEIPSDVTFVDLDVSNATTHEVYPAIPWYVLTSGGGTGDTMPEQCCALVVGRTNAPHTLGRKFLGPFIEASNSDGTWRGTLLTMLGAFLVDYLDEFAVLTYGALAPVVVRYTNNSITRIKDLLTGATSNAVYTQRRRRRGVGA